MADAEKTRTAKESVAATGAARPTAEDEYREEHDTYAILAAMKPRDANDAVLRTAQWLAEHEHRALHVVSVIETAPLISAFGAGGPTIPPFHDEEGRSGVKRDIRAAYERAGQSAPRFRIDVVEGSAPAVIADIADEQEVRLVVVGKGTHGLLSHLVHGDQVLEIIRRSRSPVLVVPPSPSVPIERAMVAFDFSMASIRATVAAQEMLGAGGRLTLVHVASPRVPDNGSRWWLRLMERRTREALREFARGLPQRAGVTVATERLYGEPVEVLTAYAQSREMQLLACGWHEHALLERMLGGSNTVELLHRAKCAVLVAPERHGGDLGGAMRAPTHDFDKEVTQ
jgi:nucleotide-binding universal stress UspA family protein